MGRTHRNIGDNREPTYASLCLGAMGSSTATLASMGSPTAAFLTYRMQMFKERLMRQSMVSPTYKSPSWRKHRYSSTFWGSVEVMRPIDEIIEVVNEDDRYGPRDVFEEPDADGRWACFVDDAQKQHQMPRWNSTSADVSWNARLKRQERSLADRYCYGELDYDSENDDDGIVRCSVQDICRDHEQEERTSRSEFSDSSSSSVTNEDSNIVHDVWPEASPLSQASSVKSRRVHTDENDRPTGIRESYFTSDRPSWETVHETDNESSEDDEEIETEEAESERVSMLFEDFPTCIVRTERRASLDEEYGTMSTSDPASQWTLIETFKLPRRIREYLADLSIAHAHDTRYIRDVHRWLFATSRVEFVFDAPTMNMWYRSLDTLGKEVLPDQPT